MRAFLSIAVPLLLPALIYWLYLKVQERRGRPVREVPISWLAVAGAILVAAVLIAGWLTGGHAPTGKYVPPSVVDGKLVPGHFEGEEIEP